MASWKKVLVSGSSIEIASITSSATPTIGTIGSNYVVMIDPTSGYVTKITSGNFQASLGQYAYTASAVSGTPVIIGAADTLNISGSDGLTTSISTISGGARINVSANAGNGIAIVGNTITVNTGSTHFTAGVKNTVFDTANFVDSPNIDFTVSAGASVTAGIITGSVVNAHLQNSAITITAGSGLTGGGSTSLGGSSTINVGAGTGITVNTDDIQLKNAGSLTNNVLPRWDSGNGQLINSAISDDGSALSLGRNTGVTGWFFATGAITGSAVSASGIVSGLSVSAAQGITAGSFIQAGTNITAPSGYISAGSPGGAPNSVGAVQGVLGFFNGLTVTGAGSIGGNLTVTGDLTVAGTASFTNVDNLTIKDKFILINSGSTTLADSGWITQYNAAGSGSAFYLEASSTGTYGRFAVAYDVIGTSTALVADEYVVTAKTAAGLPSAAPTWGSTGNGFGNIYVNSSNGDIYMYS